MNNFDSLISGDKPVLVDFYATWCAPCRLMPPVLKEVKERVGEHAVIIQMDIDKNPEYAERYQVQSVPTIMIFRNNHPVWRASGVQPARVLVQELAKYQY